MAEKQADHRRHLESQITSSDITNSRVGLVFGLIIGLGGIVAATVQLCWRFVSFGVIGWQDAKKEKTPNPLSLQGIGVNCRRLSTGVKMEAGGIEPPS
ncbi:MAG: hypothetical protein JWP89_363 [Schlesneria sp.]|nr:hypothetical protein [Schlesneria sp.]